MQLKRVFDKDKSKGLKLDHVKVLTSSEVQKFSTGFVEKQTASGLVSIGDGKITLKTVPPLSYKIVRGPGMYCCHCDAPLDDRPEALLHLKASHDGLESPDKQNPSGYRVDHFYFCEKEKE